MTSGRGGFPQRTESACAERGNTIFSRFFAFNKGKTGLYLCGN
jgi:hypothetical protein